jgi:hypothetical protein
MITTIDGKEAHNPMLPWNYHVWAEVWINDTELDNGEWKPIATTYQVGPKSRCDALYQTEIESHDEYGNDVDGFADGVLTDKVVPHWIFWWKLEKDDILDKYKECQASTIQLAEAEPDDQLEINVTTDKSQYNLGEDVTINITVTNKKDNQVTENLTTTVIGMAAGGLMDYKFEDAREITIPPHSTTTELYTLLQEDLVRNRHYTVISYTRETRGSTEFYVVGGINLTVTLPETVLIDESFDVRLVVENIADVPIDNIEISAGIGSDATVTGAPINFVIPTLAPGSTHLTTWSVSMPNDGYQSMVFGAQSERGDYEQIFAGIEVMSDPFLRVDVEVPSSVQKDTTFAVNVTIVNEGDLAAEGVQSTLNLPPGLTTPDDWIRNIGTIEPHANTTIVWDITANEAGTLSFTILTSSSTTSGEDVIFIPIFIYDHDLELSVEQSQLEADGELHCINMTIHNLGNVEDSVLLQYLVTNPDISFSIYDGDERIIAQPVTVPASGDKILNLKIIPEPAVTGTITIHATSELDPTASDSTNIDVVLPADVADVAVFSNSWWFVDTTGNHIADLVFLYGAPSHVPLVGDVNQDGSDDVVIFSNGWWFVDTTGNQIADHVFLYGAPGHVPVVGDINQDGLDDTAVFSNGLWFVDTTGNHIADLVFLYGGPGNTPVVGDVNQDGTDDTVIFSGGWWFVDTTGNHIADLVFLYGAPGSVPVVGNIG